MRLILIVCTLTATCLLMTFTYCHKFSWVQNFVTVRLVTKITKISTPRKLPAILYAISLASKRWKLGLCVCQPWHRLQAGIIAYRRNCADFRQHWTLICCELQLAKQLDSQSAAFVISLTYFCCSIMIIVIMTYVSPQFGKDLN